MSLHWISAAVRSFRTLPGPFRIIQWLYKPAPDGRSVTFQYNGNQGAPGNNYVRADQGIENRFLCLYLYPRCIWKTFRSSWDSWILTGPWHLSPFRLEQMRFCRAAVIWNYTAILKHFQSNYNIDLEKYCAETRSTVRGNGVQRVGGF